MRGSVDLPPVSLSHRKLLCTLWCLLDSKTSLCCLLSRLSSLSLRLLIIQRQPELRSSAAAVLKKKEERRRRRRSKREDGDHPAAVDREQVRRRSSREYSVSQSSTSLHNNALELGIRGEALLGMTWKCALNASIPNVPRSPWSSTRCSSRVFLHWKERRAAGERIRAAEREMWLALFWKPLHGAPRPLVSQSQTDATRAPRSRDVTRVLQCGGVKIALMFFRDGLQVFVAAGVEWHRGFLQKMESGEQRLTFSCCHWPLHGAGRSFALLFSFY